jgi:hypothetical protein
MDDCEVCEIVTSKTSRQVARLGSICISEISLASSIGESYSFAGFGLVPEVFSGTIRPQNGTRAHGAQLDASLRFF